MDADSTPSVSGAGQDDCAGQLRMAVEDTRARVAQQIGSYVRTPSGVEMSDVTKAYLHAAHIAATGCTSHDAWTPCPHGEHI